MPSIPVRSVLLALLLLLPLAACGGKEESEEESSGKGAYAPSRSEPDSPGSEATALPTGEAPETEPMAQVELTDELVDKYLDVLEEVTKGGSLSTLLPRYRLNAERYGAIAEQFHTAATLGMMSGLAETFDKQIQEMEKQLETADAESKPFLEQGLAALKEQRKRMASEGMDSELAKRNAEVLQRHLPRFQKLSEGAR
jgi:hypothetical protein